MRKLTRGQWAGLALVLLVSFLLRAHYLSRIFIWLDETDFFNEYIYRNPPKALLDFAVTTKNATTNTWGWPAVIWLTCRGFGATIGVARAPAVVVGTVAVLLVFVLLYGILPEALGRRRFVPAVLAAAITAAAMPQIEFAQRTYPYGAVPCMAALFLLAHLAFREAIQRKPESPGFSKVAVLYTAAGCACLCIHVSLALLIAVSLALLALPAARHFAARSREQRRSLVRLACVMGCAFLVAGIINAKNPKFGYRQYLERYYHDVSLRSARSLLLHSYDLATYHLNLFYNPGLYWPERVNWAILPLVACCAMGWICAAAGKFGLRARHFALFGLFATAMPAALSLIRKFPFGGVRQTLFLSPFLLIFTALGFYALLERRPIRIAAILAALIYVGLWCVNLPRFYRERVAPYTAQELVNIWRQNDSLQVYMRGGNEREIQYTMREHPEVPLAIPSLTSKPPYLLITTHYQIDNPMWFPGFLEYLRNSHYKARLIAERPPAHPESLEYRTCLYFPPNGLWIYKVTLP